MLHHTVSHASGHLWLRAAVFWLILTGPVLLLPNLVGPRWQELWLSSAGTGALGLCAIGLARYRAIRIWGWCLVLAVVVSWFHHNARDLAATSHFGGIAFGLLLMTVVGHVTTSPRSLLVGFWVLVMAGSAVVVLGLFGLSAASVAAIKFERLGPWAVAVLSQLPNITLNLPGMDDSGQVNANALGGTAAMVLPLAAGLIFAARRKNGAVPAWLLASVGVCASTVVLLTISLTLSRAAMGAVLCTVVIAGLRFRASRRWTVGAVIAAAAIAAVSLGPTGSKTPRAVKRATVSLDTRLTIWGVGVERLKASPWTGVGINQFRDVAPYKIEGRTDVGHSHNIFLQTALDVGIPGLLAYTGLIGSLIWWGLSAAALRGAIPAVAVAASLSLLVTHLFGLLDAITLGAKVGAIQWACAGLILGASAIRQPGDSAR
jgi:O-antigen ligase